MKNKVIYKIKFDEYYSILGVHNGLMYHALVYNKPYKDGIENGRIRKLWVHPYGNPAKYLAVYVHGWKIKKRKYKAEIKEIIKKLEWKI